MRRVGGESIDAGVSFSWRGEDYVWEAFTGDFLESFFLVPFLHDTVDSRLFPWVYSLLVLDHGLPRCSQVFPAAVLFTLENWLVEVLGGAVHFRVVATPFQSFVGEHLQITAE